MEIRNNPFEDRARRTNQSADITRPNRETIERSNLDLSERAAEAAARRDRLDVDATRLAERAERSAREEDAQRAERVRELEQAHRNGDLNTDARISRAAIRMLEGE